MDRKPKERAVCSRRKATSSVVDITDAGILPEILDILDALPFYVLLVDAEHNILQANSAVQKELGVKREDIIGKYCPQVIHGLEKPFDGCPLEEAAEKDQAIERIVLDPKSGRWLISAIYPTRALTRDDKKIFLHMVTDVTDHKKAEDELKISHERLRILSAYLESVREEERKKIAADLHDETSQVVASLNAHLEAAASLLPGNADRAKAILRRAQALSISILDEIHKLISELRPALLDDLGLVAAIRWLVDNNLRAAGITVNFKSTGAEKKFSPQLEIAIYRVIQEAFNNIVKHSRAKNVTTYLSLKRDAIKVRIRDNGIGFDVEDAINSKERPRGLGLLGMKERMKLINGNLTIKSRPGGGTEIIIEAPLVQKNYNG